MIHMTEAELWLKLEKFLPYIDIQTDNQGQVIIYTGLMYDEDDNLVDWVAEEEE